MLLARLLSVTRVRLDQHLVLFNRLHLLNASFSDFNRRDVIVFNKVFLHIPDLFMVNGAASKRNSRFVLLAGR